MNEQQRKAMEQALKALENAQANVGEWWPEAITALKEALAQPEQEPMAVVTGMYGGRFTYAPFKSTVVLPVGAALYLQPPQRKPLTDEQINQIADEFIVNYRIPAGSHSDFARAIEAAHGVKENT